MKELSEEAKQVILERVCQSPGATMVPTSWTSANIRTQRKPSLSDLNGLAEICSMRQSAI